MLRPIFVTVCSLLFINTLSATKLDTTHLENLSLEQTDVSTSLKRSPIISLSHYLSMPEVSQKRIASVFNLKPEEYQQYLNYMTNTMDGYEYDQTINPNLILAMHTKNSILYKRYLSNVARADHEALTRLLKVTVDYPRIMRELYPNEMPIMTPAMRAQEQNQLTKGDVVQLFCRPNSAICSNILSVIKLPILNSLGARLDLFFVGKVNRGDIINFAKHNAISPVDVTSHRVTLNFGNQVFTVLEKQTDHRLPLPYLLVRRDGQIIPVNLGEKNA